MSRGEPHSRHRRRDELIKGFGRRLRALFGASRFLEQAELARAAGYAGPGGLQHVLDGRSIPTADRLLGLADAFGVSVADLFAFPEAQTRGRRG